MENSIIWIIGMKERGLRNRTAYIEFGKCMAGYLHIDMKHFTPRTTMIFFTAFIDQLFNHERVSGKK